ncbi:MAG: DUF6657 family protein [Sphaerochaetaceae bacterium]
MSVIKSAWEIALEKTQDINVDPEKIAKTEKIQDGRKLAAAFLQDDDQTPEMVQKKLKGFKGNEKELILKGVATTILDNISLPQNEGYKERFSKVEKLTALTGNHELIGLVGQLDQFFEQYLSQVKQMTEQAKRQYQPRQEQKQAQLRAQYGDDIVLKPEQDPEFIKLLDKALKQLDTQYGQAVSNAKEEIKATFGLDQT